MKQILFVSGTGRSGTSALVNVLNSHPKMLIGQERFFWKFRREEISPELFEKVRFLDVRRPEDTHNHAGLKQIGEAPSVRFDNAIYIGDKFPSLFRHFDYILPMFPDAKHLYIVRNPLSVIESYDVRYQDPSDSWSLTWKDGMDAWNESVRKVARLPDQNMKNFLLIEYEELFKSVDRLNALFRQLKLDPLDNEKLQSFVAKFEALNNKAVIRRDDLRLYVSRNADWDAYKILCDRIFVANG